MEVVFLFLLQFMIQTSHELRSNENAAAGEIWTNQTDLEVVNGTNIQNMLHKCEGCLINVKSVPYTPSDDNTVQKHIVKPDAPTSNETKSEGPPLKNQKDVTVDHASTLREMVKNCQGCYVDYQTRPPVHSKLHKHKKKKKKSGPREGFDFKSDSRVATQPPETQEVPGNIPYRDDVPQGNQPDGNSVPINNEALYANTNEAPNNPTDEQLGNMTPINNTVPVQTDAKYQNSSDTNQEDRQVIANQTTTSPIGTVSDQNITTATTNNQTMLEENSAPITIEISSRTPYEREGIDHVSPKELKSLLKKKDVRVIDLRETWEINNSGRISDSVHIALNSLGLALKLTEKKFKMKYGVNKPETDDCNLVFVDSSGERSDIAYKYAKEHGYQCPRSLAGGFDLWKTAIGTEESTYDEMPKANLTTISVNNGPRPLYEMKKMKKTIINY